MKMVKNGSGTFYTELLCKDCYKVILETLNQRQGNIKVILPNRVTKWESHQLPKLLSFPGFSGIQIPFPGAKIRCL